MVKIFSRKFFLLILLLFSGMGCSDRYNQTRLEKEGCVRIPLTYFPFSEAAIAQIEIEGEKYSLLVDVGANFYFTLQKKCLNEIKNKKLTDPSKGRDIKGNAYSEDNYKVELINISNIKIEGVPVKEKSLEYMLNSHNFSSSEFTEREKQQMEFIHGNIGNRFFENFVCLFDLNAPNLLLSQNLDSMKKIHSLEGFAEISFKTTSNGFVILDVDTDFGTKRMLLDSGASHSILKKSEVGAKTRYAASQTMKINNCDFGAWDFFLYEFTDQFPERFDAILGVDFFKDHIICIDYKNNKAYIKAHKKPFKKNWAKIQRYFSQ